jgi:hypothetical protein
MEPSSSLALPVVCFVGGADDSQHRNLWRVFDAYRRAVPGHASYYFFHDQHTEIGMRIRASQGPVCLVGHSWGGDTVLDVAYHRRERPIELVVTLDPVARFTNWICTASHVGWWINVRVDPTGPGSSNVIAQLGGHYGRRIGADRDIDLGRLAVHADAPRMFAEVADLVRTFEQRDFFSSGAPSCEQGGGRP